MLIRIVPGPAAARCCVRMRAARLTGWALGELTWEERLKEELQREGMFPQRDALGPCGVRLWGCLWPGWRLWRRQEDWIFSWRPHQK